MTTIRELMSTAIVSVTPATTIAEAATVMGHRGVGSALVMQDDRLAGIFTERDILRALASDFDAAGHAVGQWMSKDPVTMGPHASTEEALDAMLEQGFRHVPVVHDGVVIGVVSLRDLTRSR